MAVLSFWPWAFPYLSWCLGLGSVQRGSPPAWEYAGVGELSLRWVLVISWQLSWAACCRVLDALLSPRAHVERDGEDEVGLCCPHGPALRVVAYGRGEVRVSPSCARGGDPPRIGVEC
eukprot:scaffold327905_cov53-Tisochrysis_lutea.AAC.1